MAKVSIIVDRNSKIHFDFQGFAGDACYLEHEKLANILAKLGLEQETESVQPKEEEQEEVREHAKSKEG